MISQAEIREPSWGLYKGLKRDISVAELKQNNAAGWQSKTALRGSGLWHSHIAPPSVPTMQTVLLLYQPRTRYSLTPKYPTPAADGDDELLLKVKVIGLNPIDWKAPDFNFGIPELPYISGRDFTGVVAQAPHASSRFKVGDTVLAVSTDYRDVRKSAFQQYAIAADSNICRLPPNISSAEGASLGVAFVAAALSLGVCFGADFSALTGLANGPDFVRLVRSCPLELLPKDIRHECLSGVTEHERPKSGDWVAIWGGSSTTSLYLVQLARLLGLRVILVGDVKKHGTRLVDRSADLLVDSYDEDRAIEIIHGVTDGKLKFAIDTTSKDTAARLADALDISEVGKRAHLVGLAGVPKISREGLALHAVPIKLFHEMRAVGVEMMEWLERLLTEGILTPPEVVAEKGGLARVNDALDRMRRGEISGQRLVVEL